MKPQEFKPHDFWQEILPPLTFGDAGGYSTFYPARFEDGRQLCLPLRQLPDGEHAVSSLIVNQASFGVQDALADALAERLAASDPQIVVGMPTLGLTVAATVARKLGHTRYVPLGTSRKFWYRAELSVPLSSITTPDQDKRLYIDPRMLLLLKARRIALVDDVISSGASMAAGLALLRLCGLEPVALGFAMSQTDRWRERLAATDDVWPDRVHAVLQTPMFVRSRAGGWEPAA